VVDKPYDFLLWLPPKAGEFLRSFRFTVGDRGVGAGLDLLLTLLEAAYTTDKNELSAAASQELPLALEPGGLATAAHPR
jgi:hypothetical protein